jgi:hypothetical protein
VEHRLKEPHHPGVTTAGKANNRLVSDILVRVFKPSSEYVSDGCVVGIGLLSKAKRCPMSNVGVPVIREGNESLDRCIVLDPAESEGHGAAHLYSWMVPELADVRRGPALIDVLKIDDRNGLDGSVAVGQQRLYRRETLVSEGMPGAAELAQDVCPDLALSSACRSA